MGLNHFLPDDKLIKLVSRHPDFKVYPDKRWATWRYSKTKQSVCVSQSVFLLRWMIYTNCEIDAYKAMTEDLGIYV